MPPTRPYAIVNQYVFIILTVYLPVYLNRKPYCKNKITSNTIKKTNLTSKIFNQSSTLSPQRTVCEFSGS